MAFPTVSLLDSFKRAAESPLGLNEPWKTDWKLINGCTATGEIKAGELYTAKTAFATGEDGAYWTLAEFTNPGVACEVRALTTAERRLDLWACLSKPTEATKSGYRLSVIAEATAGKYTFKLEKCVTGTFSTLVETTAIAVAVGDRIGISVQAGKVIAWKKVGAGAWEEVNSKADAAFTKGFVGIISKGTGLAEARNFEAGPSTVIVQKLTAKLEPAIPSFSKLLKAIKNLRAVLGDTIEYGAALGMDMLGALQLGGLATENSTLTAQLPRRFEFVRTFVAQLGGLINTAAASLAVNSLTAFELGGSTGSTLTANMVPFLPRTRFLAVLSWSGHLTRTVRYSSGTAKFPIVTLLDSFKRAEENPLSNGGKWGLNKPGKNTGAVKEEAWLSLQNPISKGISAAYWTLREYTRPGVAVQVHKLGEHTIELWACLKKPTEAKKSAYVLEVQEEELAGKRTFVLRRFLETEVTTELARTENVTVAVGDRLGISVQNGKVRGWLKKGTGAWEVIVEVADANITVGFVGLSGQESLEVPFADYTNFEAGELTAIIRMIAELGSASKSSRNALRAIAASLKPEVTEQRNTLHAFLAALKPAGSLIPKSEVIVEHLMAALSFLGILPRNTTHALPASLSFLGALPRNITDFLAAHLSFTGALPRNITRSTEAELGLAGTLPRNTTAALLAKLTFAGTLSRNILRNLSATLTPEAHLGRAISHVLSASVSFVGSLPRETLHALEATIEFVGNPQRVIVTTRIATLSFVGSLEERLSKNFEAVLSFVGTLPRNIRHRLSGILSFSTTLLDDVIFPLRATISFDVTLRKEFELIHRLEASLSFIGALPRNIRRLTRAHLTPEGTLPRNTTHELSATLSSAVILSRAITAALAASLALEVTAGRSTVHNLEAALSPTGRLSRAFLKGLAATLAFEGRLRRSVAHLLTSSLNFRGNLTSLTRHGFEAALELSARINRESIRKVLQASLSFTASLPRQITHSLRAALSFLGRIRRPHAGTLVDYVVLKFVSEPPSLTVVYKEGKPVSVIDRLSDYPDTELSDFPELEFVSIVEKRRILRGNN
jgi:hypothetical protein